MHAWTKRRYKEWLHRQRPLAMRTDEVSDDEVIRAIKSVPDHRVTWTLVQQVSGFGSAVSPGTSVTNNNFPGNTTSGNFVIATICLEGVGADTHVTTVQDAQSNNGSKLIASGHLAGHDSCEIWIVPISTGGSGALTVNVSGSSYILSLSPIEFSPPSAGTASADGSGATDSGSSSAPDTGSFTTTNATSTLRVILFACPTNFGAISAYPTGYTKIQEHASGTDENGSSAYKISSGSTTDNPTWTMPGSISWIGAGIGAQIGGGGGGFNAGWAYGATRSPGGVF